MNAAAPERVFVEAEAFDDLGGWVVDQQFMDQMGSPFLLAHGIGRPVADATTKVRVPAAGDWRLFVRTRDWVAPFGPGRFRVAVGGRESKELGAGDGAWHWEDCGAFPLAAGETEVRLHDLTGFEGRVDALCLVRGDAPPERPGPAVEDGGDFDFVVVGGGFAGMCAAVAAARLGTRTLLVNDRPSFGGNGSNECRVRPHGELGGGRFPRNADLMRELAAMMPRRRGEAAGDDYALDDAAVAAWLATEPYLAVRPFTRCVAAETGPDGAIEAVVLHDVRTARRARVRARLFCDATGDASLAEKAGARTRWDAEPREETGEALAPPAGRRRDAGGLESSCYWFSREADGPRPFPGCPWALRIDREEDALVGDETGKPDWLHSGGWSWGSGFYRDPVADGEAIRDWNFRAVYGLWDFLKNRSPQRARYANAEIYWLAHVLAKRDAHRIAGDFTVSSTDMLEGRAFPDGVVAASWFPDLHVPAPAVEAAFPGGAFRTLGAPAGAARRRVRAFEIPYRCLCSRDVPNLFAAGKDVSGTYLAMAAYRVENTCGMMGTAVGRAAALCLRLGVLPRALGRDRFPDLASMLADPR